MKTLANFFLSIALLLTPITPLLGQMFPDCLVEGSESRYESVGANSKMPDAILKNKEAFVELLNWEFIVSTEDSIQVVGKDGTYQGKHLIIRPFEIEAHGGQIDLLVKLKHNEKWLIGYYTLELIPGVDVFFQSSRCWKKKKYLQRNPSTQRAVVRPTYRPSTRSSSSGTGTKHISKSSRRYIRGPRGGCYYLSGSGKKVYVSRSLCN
jgi:hypothetical protein